MNPLIYAIKTYEYISSLRKLIRKLRLFFTHQNVRKKIIKSSSCLLSNQKIGGRLPLSFFLKILIKTMRKPFSQSAQIAQESFICAEVKYFRLLGLCGRRKWGPDTGEILIKIISSCVSSVRVAYFYAVMNELASDLLDRSVSFPGISVPKTVRKFLTPVIFLRTSREGGNVISQFFGILQIFFFVIY